MTIKEYDLYFEEIAHDVSDLLRNRDWKLVKYYHGIPSWHLRFLHPKGGDGMIDLVRGVGDHLLIGSFWTIDDRKLARRYMHRRPVRTIARVAGLVRPEIEAEYEAITSVPYGAWNYEGEIAT